MNETGGRYEVETYQDGKRWYYRLHYIWLINYPEGMEGPPEGEITREGPAHGYRSYERALAAGREDAATERERKAARAASRRIDSA